MANKVWNLDFAFREFVRNRWTHPSLERWRAQRRKSLFTRRLRVVRYRNSFLSKVSEKLSVAHEDGWPTRQIVRKPIPVLAHANRVKNARYALVGPSRTSAEASQFSNNEVDIYVQH